MARLADHIEQMKDKNLLIIHPTADGNPSFIQYNCTNSHGSIMWTACALLLNASIEKNWSVIISFCAHRESPFSAHGKIYHPHDRWKGQLYITGKTCGSAAVSFTAIYLNASIFQNFI